MAAAATAEAQRDARPTQADLQNALADKAKAEAQRDALAVLFAEEYASGMFNALEVLHAAQCAPFDRGYDGDPSDDFLGRMDGWTWPEE